MRKVNQETLDLIKGWEGCKLKAYLDVAGIPTIGYGHTKGVALGMRISQQQAEDFLEEDLVGPQREVERSVKVPLTDNQFGALVSFTFNLGEAAFRGSTLLKALNKGAYHEVPAQLMRWNKAKVNGKLQPVDGLSNRRAAEAGLWARGNFVSSNTVEATPTRAPMGKADVGAGGGLLTAAGTMVDKLSEHSDKIDQVSWFLSGPGIVSIVAGVAMAACLAYLLWSWYRRSKG